MEAQANVGEMNLSGLRHRCTQESENFFHRQNYDPRYCFELFRRAILQKNERAWESVYQQYQPLVISWVERHPIATALDEEVQYFVNRAFEKMWVVMTPEKFLEFDNLKSVLRYLQMCVHSCIVDHMRAKDRAILLEDEEMDPTSVDITEHETLEERAAAQADAVILWDWLAERLKNEQERVVVYGSFVLAMKPREIFEEYTGIFHDIKEIYMTKENVITRLQRDPNLAQLFKEG